MPMNREFRRHKLWTHKKAEKHVHFEGKRAL